MLDIRYQDYANIFFIFRHYLKRSRHIWAKSERDLSGRTSNVGKMMKSILSKLSKLSTTWTVEFPPKATILKSFGTVPAIRRWTEFGQKRWMLWPEVRRRLPMRRLVEIPGYIITVSCTVSSILPCIIGSEIYSHIHCWWDGCNSWIMMPCKLCK